VKNICVDMYLDFYSQVFDILDFSSSRVLNLKGVLFSMNYAPRLFFQCLSHVPEEETSRLKRTLGGEEYWIASKRVLSQAPAVVRRD
jgi:hypothetical protein